MCGDFELKMDFKKTRVMLLPKNYLGLYLDVVPLVYYRMGSIFALANKHKRKIRGATDISVMKLLILTLSSSPSPVLWSKAGNPICLGI